MFSHKIIYLLLFYFVMDFSFIVAIIQFLLINFEIMPKNIWFLFLLKDRNTTTFINLLFLDGNSLCKKTFS